MCEPPTHKKNLLPSSDGVNHTHMAYREVWSNAAVGQQERGGWVGAEQKGEDSRVRQPLLHLHLVSWFTRKRLPRNDQGTGAPYSPPGDTRRPPGLNFLGFFFGASGTNVQGSIFFSFF